MARDNLIRRLGRGFRKVVLIGTTLAVLGTASCRHPTPTPINHPPTASLSVDPTSGNAPLETLIQLDGTDLDGKDDIIEYKIGEDKNNDGDIDDSGETITQSSNPIIDYPVTFNSSGTKKIYGQVMDSQGAIGKAGPVLVDVSQPENNPPQITSTPITEVNEGEQYYYDVDAIDSDGDILTYSLNQAPNWLSIDSSIGEIVGVPEKVITDEKLDIIVGVSDGKDSTTQEYVLTVYNLLDVEGQLQDNETDSPQTGTVRVYDSLKNFLSKIQTDANGYFSAQLNKRISELPDGTIVQAAIDDNQDGNLESYVRTRKFPAGDIRDLIIRAVPYDNPNDTYDDELIDYPGHPGQITSEEFKSFMEETNFDGATVTNNEHGLKKWNFGELPDLVQHPVFKGIQIIKTNPNNPNDYFVKPEKVRNALRSSVYPKVEEIYIEIYPDETDIKRFTKAPDRLVPDSGWGIIYPDDTPGGYGAAAGATVTYDKVWLDGYIERFRVEIKPINESNKRVLVHEAFGHGMNYPDPNHTTLNESIMNPLGIDPDTGLSWSDFTSADIKGSYIVNEPTYKGMESSDDIMALNFY